MFFFFQLEEGGSCRSENNFTDRRDKSQNISLSNPPTQDSNCETSKSKTGKTCKRKNKKQKLNTPITDSQVFPGSNLHNLRGYLGLSETTVREELLKKEKKKKGKK